jgi:hypothetical protein
MNPRIAKEVRTQAPVFGLLVACALVAVAVSLVQAPYVFIDIRPMLLGIYLVGCLLMAALTFGNEFQHRTMSLLLSQPVARRTLWPQKMRVLASLSGYSAFITLIALLSGPTLQWDYSYHDLFLLCGYLVAVPILFCCTTPYFTLVSKSTLGGIVFTIFSSGMLYALSGAIWDQLSVLRGLGELKDKLTLRQLDGPTFIFVILSVPYCTLLYWLGRRRFLRLEVIDSQSLEANLPQGLETTLANFSAKFKSPFSRLLFKELRLQRISLLLTAMFCLFIAVERLTWNGNNQRTFVVAGTLGIYFFLFPVIVCATAVADEKTWGMKDWHLTLPPSLKLQWRLKWLVALTLSLVFGVALTWLLARSGPWQDEIKPRFEPEFLCYPLLVGVALYAASISTSAIRAVLLTFGMIVAYWFISSLILSPFFTAQVGFGPEDSPLAALGFLLVSIYVAVVHLLYKLLWCLIVYPVWWTGSMEKTRAAALWVDTSVNNHLQIIVLSLCAAGIFWLLLRFARANYRYGDLSKRKIARQLALLLLASGFICIAVASTRGPLYVWDNQITATMVVRPGPPEGWHPVAPIQRPAQ